MFRKVITTLFGDPNAREIERHMEVVQEINALEDEMKRLQDGDFRAQTAKFRERLEAGETRDDLLPEAFALVREAARRAVGMRHYDVQMVGGIVLHQGKIAEMKTGEGKTLVATLPLYLNGLEGQGAHLVTPNDYLSKYGVQWMGPVYHLLGMTVGVIQGKSAEPSKDSFVFDPDYASDDDRYQHLRPVERAEAYRADITYGTNNEFGFDYLRDNMAHDLNKQAQRRRHYAIIDEVDNILIDEARTPLIISGPAEAPSEYYKVFAGVVRGLRPSSEQSVEIEDPDGDYVFDEKTRNVTLTEDGLEKVERALERELGQEVDNLYGPEFSELVPYLDNALRANVAYKRDRDYVVQGEQVIIVDDFTGRMMYGRRYSEGLHQSIEAKEGVEIRRENLTLATITFQNFFRMYEKLAGMTGTAATEAEEFEKIYELEVTVIPTHEPVVREDMEDLVFVTESAKFDAAVQELKWRHEAGQPVLVGTASISTSERLSRLLDRAGVPHNVLNAKQHEREALIIAQAGQPGKVTIATNMAGRGVDILLGGNPEGLARAKLRQQGIDITEATDTQWQAALNQAQTECQANREAVLHPQEYELPTGDIIDVPGGLHVLGTERHEARRIDNQLRGRAGRQGDPGSSQFYLSLEDDLMRRFGGDRLKNYMSTVSRMQSADGEDESLPITHNWISKAIAQAQTRVEGYNFDIRKRVLEYDDVVNKQREVIYAQRQEALEAESLRGQIIRMIRDELNAEVNAHLVQRDPMDPELDEWDLDGLHRAALAIFPVPEDLNPETWEGMESEDIARQLVQAAEAAYEDMETRYAEATVQGRPFMRYAEKRVLLDVVDKLWVHHLTDLDVLREGIGLQAYAQRDPLVEYKREAHIMWDQLLGQIQSQVAQTIFRVQPQAAQQPRQQRQVREVRPAVSSAPPEPEPLRTTKWDEVGRNDPCPCGSGKKFKHCHYREIQRQRQTVAQDKVKQRGSSRRRRRR